MSIASDLSRLQGAKANIKTAIENKGVTVPSEAKLDSYNGYIQQISGGSAYAPPADWINIDDCASGNIQLLVSDIGLATYAFVCTTDSGNYQVDWGDETVLTYSSGAKAQHTYTIGAGQTCSRGYTTFKIIISPVSGGLKSFKVSYHSLANRSQFPGVLGCVINSAALTDLTNAFYCSTTVTVYSVFLEFFKGVNTSAVTDAPYMFCSCTLLQSVDLSTFTELLNASHMFQSCSSLQLVDVSAMAKITNAAYMFNGCSSLQLVNIGETVAITDASYMFCNCNNLLDFDLSNFTESTNAAYMFSNCALLHSVDASAMTKITNASRMFNGCNSLKSINISSMALVTDASNMFSNCYTLQEIVSSNFGGAAVSTDLSNAFFLCEQLKNINFPDSKIARITASGSAGVLNKLETLTFSPDSTFGSATAPQIDIRYNTLTADQLNAIFTGLPTVYSYKAINIVGCTGAAACDKTIATAKNWTVVSS